MSDLMYAVKIIMLFLQIERETLDSKDGSCCAKERFSGRRHLWRDSLKPEDTLIRAIINVCVLHVSGMCWMRGMWQDQYLFRHEWQIELGA